MQGFKRDNSSCLARTAPRSCERRHLFERVAECERRSLLRRREFLEGGNELRGKGLRRIDDETILDEKLPVGVRGDVGTLKRIRSKVEYLAQPKRDERFCPHL